jgi:biopolymer transport protein ExbB/TolQ
MKLDYASIWQSIKDNKGKLSIVALAILLIVVSIGMYQCGSNYFANRKIKKLQENVNSAMVEAANLKQQAANLEVKKVEAQANVNAATKEYQDNVYGREQVKQETNQALANYQKALNTNTNVDRTAEDFEQKLKELDGNQ